jgi:hypothetical protein
MASSGRGGRSSHFISRNGNPEVGIFLNRGKRKTERNPFRSVVVDLSSFQTVQWLRKSEVISNELFVATLIKNRAVICELANETHD